MKNLTVFLSLFCIVPLFAQKMIPAEDQDLWELQFPTNEEGKVQFSESFEIDLSMSQLHANMASCFVELIKNNREARVRATRDEDNYIRMRGSSTVSLRQRPLEGKTGIHDVLLDLYYNYTIAITDGKYDYTLTDFEVKLSEEMEEERQREEWNLHDILRPLERMVMFEEQDPSFASSEPIQQLKSEIITAINDLIDQIRVQMEKS